MCHLIYPNVSFPSSQKWPEANGWVKLIIHSNPNHSGYATFLYTGSQYLNLGNKKADINVKKTVVYNIENGKNSERLYYFRSTFTVAKFC